MAKKNSHHRVQQRVTDRATRIQNETAAARKSWAVGDSFQNAAARLGLGAGSQQDASRYAFDFVSRNRVQMEAAYRSNWICGMAVDVVAEDMTRAGIEILSKVAPDDLEKIQRAFVRMRLWDSLCDTIKWGRLYGGAGAYIMIDGQDPSTPLRIDSVSKGQFKGLMVMDRWMVQPSLTDLVQDLGPDIGMPKFYTVLPDSRGLIGQKIHYSRFLRFEGLDLPYWQRISENLWGQSVLERVWDRIIAFDSTTEGAAQLVYRAHLRTISVAGLRELIATGGKALDGFVQQMEFIRKYQSIEGLTVIDGNDTFEAHSYTFTGLPDVLLQFAQQISGALQIPLVRLLGQSPAGLNSTGEGDERQYHEGINQKQERQLRTPLSRLLDLTFRSELGRPAGDDMDFLFSPLRQMTPEEKANVAKTTTDAITAAESGGIISQKTALMELRQASRITGIFTNISDEDIEAAEDEPPDPSELAGADPMDPNAPPKPGAKPSKPAPAKAE